MQQQLQDLSQGHSKLGQDVAALRATSPSSSSPVEPSTAPLAGHQAAGSPAQTAVNTASAGSTMADAAGNLAIGSGAGAATEASSVSGAKTATGAVALQGPSNGPMQPYAAQDKAAEGFSSCLDALAAEVGHISHMPHASRMICSQSEWHVCLAAV